MINKTEIQSEPLKRGDVVKTSNGTMGVVLEETEDKRAYYTVVFVSGTTPRMTYYTVSQVERMKQGQYVIPSKIMEIRKFKQKKVTLVTEKNDNFNGWVRSTLNQYLCGIKQNRKHK